MQYRQFVITTRQSQDGKWKATVQIAGDTDPANAVETMEYMFDEYAVAEAKNICDGVVPDKPAPTRAHHDRRQDGG